VAPDVFLNEHYSTQRPISPPRAPLLSDRWQSSAVPLRLRIVDHRIDGFAHGRMPNLPLQGAQGHRSPKQRFGAEPGRGRGMSTQHPQASRISTKQNRRLVLLAILLLIAYGLVFGGGYGASIDEPRHAKFGRDTLRAYLGQGPVDSTAVDPVEHGPFYSFISYYAGGWVEAIHPGWTPTDGRHFIYYLSFVMATIFIWLLARRYVRAATAWLASALFFTQPLLLGHAFINPKDVPFMAFFLGSLTLGLLALPGHGSAVSLAHTAEFEQDDPLSAIDRRRLRRRLLFGWTLLTVAGLSVLWLWTGLLPFLHSVLAAAYRGEAPWPIQLAFNTVATDAYKTPLDLYAGKLVTAFVWIRGSTTFILVIGALFGWVSAAWPKVRPTILAKQDYLLVAGAGIMLGLDTSIRSVAPWAAVPLVVLYLLFAGSRRKAGLHILILTATSVVACLATWPFLWQDTLLHYAQSVLTLSDFPWQGIMLFNGQILSQGQQPWYFIPELMLLQVTLPVLALALLGLVSARRWLRSSQARVEIVLVLVTFALPIVASFRPGTIVYNNFRQFLFTVPAFFLLAALGLERIFKWLHSPRWRIAVAAIALLPGIIGIIRLYPYEYIYYNALAGMGGAVYSRFESDYWCTSYRALTEWANENAPQGATLYVGNGGLKSQVSEFSRSDLLVLGMGSYDDNHPPTLAVICDGKGRLLNVYPNAPVLMTIEREGAILGEVKDLRPQP